jgi:hypothetical protein
MWRGICRIGALPAACVPNAARFRPLQLKKLNLTEKAIRNCPLKNEKKLIFTKTYVADAEFAAPHVRKRPSQ